MEWPWGQKCSPPVCCPQPFLWCSLLNSFSTPPTLVSTWYRKSMSKLVGEWEIPVNIKVKKWQISVAIVQFFCLFVCLFLFFFYLKVFGLYSLAFVGRLSYMQQAIMCNNIYMQICFWLVYQFWWGPWEHPHKGQCVYSENNWESVVSFLSSSPIF